MPTVRSCTEYLLAAYYVTDLREWLRSYRRVPESPFKGSFELQFYKKKSTQTNAAVGSLQTLPDKINGPSGVKGERSRPLSEAFPCTQCVILKKVGTGWFNLDHEEKASFFFSFPNACVLGFIIDYPCWPIWGKHLSHLKTCHDIKSG